MSAAATIAAGCGGFDHPALFYETHDEYLDGIVPFLREGIELDQPALVAVPASNLELIKRTLNGAADEIEFIDMTSLGRNPSRIIPAVRRFTDTHAERRTRFVGEPIWDGRGAAEIREATRHEALLNLAFADVPVTILCPYDAGRLDATVLADAKRTHPHLIQRASRRPSEEYRGTALAFEAALPPAPGTADAFVFDGRRLAALRRFIADQAASACLGQREAQDLILAVNELASNAVLHARPPGGTVRCWQERDTRTLICEVTDRGHIQDPLAGRRAPASPGPGGMGLWLSNQICDLVELHSSPAGTTTRLHVHPGR